MKPPCPSGAICLRSPLLEAWILPLGATLIGLWHRDLSHSLTLGFADTLAYQNNDIYAGVVVGPVANRIANARMDISGTPYILPENEGATCLHSGADGLHNRGWTVVAQTGSRLTLQCELQDQDIGLPGHRRVEITYDLSGSSSLDLKIRATTDRDTVMNIAHHPYWSMDGLPDVSGHTLNVKAQNYLPVDASMLPTGQITSVAGTEYDFIRPRPVPVHTSLDANLCLDADRHATLRKVASLTGVNGFELQISTTEPGLQVYNGSALPARGTPLIDGRILAPYSGIALEPQGWPDAPNNPSFPSISLAQGETYFQHTRYDFS